MWYNEIKKENAMQIVITIHDNNQVSFSTNAPMSFTQFLDATATVQHALLEQTADRALQETDTDIKEQLFDQYNETVSNVLNVFLPNHLRRDITEEAILTLESQLLEKELNDHAEKVHTLS